MTDFSPAGKAAKYIGKLGFKLARNFGSDDPKPLSSGRTFEEDASSGNEGKKAHHLRALVAGHDGSVWVGFKAGRIERFRFNAKLLWSKVYHDTSKIVVTSGIRIRAPKPNVACSVQCIPGDSFGL